MVIVYISDVDISKSNGPGVNEREFVASLRDKLDGNAIFIIPKPLYLIDWRTDARYLYPSMNFPLLEKTHLLFFYTSFVQIMQYIRVRHKRNVDLVVFRLRYNSLLCALYMKLIRQPFAIKTLGNKGRVPEKRPKSIISLVVRRVILSLVTKVLHSATAIDMCTPQFYEYYSRKLPEEKLLVVENNVNVNRFFKKNKEEVKKRLGFADFDKIVGYVGGSPSGRGASQLVEISKKLKAKYPCCGIVIVGHDSKLDSLKKMTKELETADRFVWVKRIPYELVVDYINCFDVGVALDTPARLSKIGNSSQKIRQYLACGIPVICSKGTNRFINEERLGYLVDQTDLDTVFEAVDAIFCLSRREAITASEKAAKYAQDNLSFEVAIDARMDFWNRQLCRVNRARQRKKSRFT